LIFKIYEYRISSGILENIRAGIPEDQLVEFRVPNHSLDSFKKNSVFFEDDEFRLNDKMYDVVKIEITSHETIFYCLPDVTESELHYRLDQFVNNTLSDNPLKKKVNINFQVFLSALFFKSPEDLKFYGLNKTKIPIPNSISISNSEIDSISPPPWHSGIAA